MPYYSRDPKRDHNFDNYPGVSVVKGCCGFVLHRVEGFRTLGLQVQATRQTNKGDKKSPIRNSVEITTSHIILNLRSPNCSFRKEGRPVHVDLK